MKCILEPENITEKLRGIANEYSIDSEEYSVIELAAKAVLFIYMSGQKDVFLKYMEEIDQELTPEMKSFLKEVGI